LTRAETDLPAGTTSFPLLIFYDPAVIASSFAATLNGDAVSSSFHPTPGGFELVNIPLVSGANVLILTISGNFGGHVATDKDRLTFGVS
jgi:H+/Cl- antiporter ClcA